LPSNPPSSRPDRESFAEGPKVRPRTDGPIEVEIVAVGRELLRGRLADANARMIAEIVGTHGAAVRRITIVDDDVSSVRSAVREALGRHPHLVFTTGGLGPAPDDVTLAGVAGALERPLTLNPRARALVEQAYGKLHRLRTAISGGLTLAREKMCRIPVGSTPIENPRGIAPGVVCRLTGGAAVVCLPGHPKEMKPVLEAALVELGDPPRRNGSAYREVESSTADESALKSLIERVADEHDGVRVSPRTVGPGAEGNRVIVTFEAVASTTDEAERRVGEAVRRLLALVSGAK
jgi:molybdenum cofactor synthesis domain-containing protein